MTVALCGSGLFTLATCLLARKIGPPKLLQAGSLGVASGLVIGVGSYAIMRGSTRSSQVAQRVLRTAVTEHSEAAPDVSFQEALQRMGEQDNLLAFLDTAPGEVSWSGPGGVAGCRLALIFGSLLQQGNSLSEEKLAKLSLTSRNLLESNQLAPRDISRIIAMVLPQSIDWDSESSSYIQYDRNGEEYPSGLVIRLHEVLSLSIPHAHVESLADELLSAGVPMETFLPSMMYHGQIRDMLWLSHIVAKAERLRDLMYCLNWNDSWLPLSAPERCQLISKLKSRLGQSQISELTPLMHLQELLGTGPGFLFRRWIVLAGSSEQIRALKNRDGTLPEVVEELARRLEDASAPMPTNLLARLRISLESDAEFVAVIEQFLTESERHILADPELFLKDLVEMAISEKNTPLFTQLIIRLVSGNSPLLENEQFLRRQHSALEGVRCRFGQQVVDTIRREVASSL